MDNWELRVVKYIGRKLDKALEEWLGLAVIIFALVVAAWFGVVDEFRGWLADNR